MGAIGTVGQCWRYPVKSLQGLNAPSLVVTDEGIEGDRQWGLIDGASGRLLSAKLTSGLLMASATDDAIELPDGTRVELTDPDAASALSQWLGQEVALVRPTPGERRSFAMTLDPPNDSAEAFDIEAPTGSFLDVAPVHLVTTATLAALAERRPDLDWDARRFRPNLVVANEGEPFAEQGWVGGRLGVGEVVLEVRQATVRCAMPLRAQPRLERQPQIYSALNELNPAMPYHLGIYADVSSAGAVAVGDEVVLLDG